MPVETMTIERAIELVSAMNSIRFWHMGLVEKPKSFGKASLAELCEAARMVREHPGEKSEHGSRHMTFPDDRLVAALFVAAHYEPSQPDRPEFIVKWPAVGFHRALVLCLLELPEGDEEVGDDE